MRKSLFFKVFAIIIIFVILCSFIAAAVIANDKTESKKSEMLTLVNYLTIIYNATDVHDEQLAEQFSSNANNMRVLFIDKNGNVLVDTSDNDNTHENHINRKEFIMASETGTGFDIRKSRTLHRLQIYVASKADNGDIIRISYDIQGFLYFVSKMAPLIITAIIVAIIAGLVITKNMINSIMSPINEVCDSLTLMKDGDYSKEIPPHKYDELNGFIYIFNSLKGNVSSTINNLKREKKLEHLILESMEEGIILINHNFNVITANSAAIQLLECNPNVKSKSIHMLVHNNTVLSAVENVINHQQSSVFDINANNKVISIHVAPVSNSLLYDYDSLSNSSELHGGLLVLTDVTEARSAEITRQEFFSNAGHELKTPLTAIIGFAELMENNLIDENKKEYCISKILSEARRMSNLINDILQISQLESSNEYIDYTECDILKITSEIADTLSLQASEKNISVSVSGTTFKIKASSKHMFELIENIVSNAIKYNKPGGSVNVSLKSSGAYGIITVSDTGIGIPLASQSRVFERFYRVDKGRTTNNGSTGLGLSIVKHIVNNYNGQISLKSEESIGTTISVYLPLN